MGGEEYRNSYRPLLPDTRCIRFNEPGDLKYITSRTACVIIEPVQGEGGIVLSEKGYLEALRRRCDETGALLVSTRYRPGWAGPARSIFQQYGVVPDILYGQGVRRRHAARSLHRSEPDQCRR